MVGIRKHPNPDLKHTASSPDTEENITHKKARTSDSESTNAVLQTQSQSMRKPPVEIMRSLKKIPPVSMYESRDGTNIQLVDFTVALAPNSEITERILNIATSPDAGNIYNIALASPSNFSRTTNGIISHKSQPSEPAMFFTTGIVQWSSITSGQWNRQICISPCNLTWTRGVSFMGQIFHEKALSFNTWNHGISFSTKNKSKTASATPTHTQRGLVNAGGAKSSQQTSLSGNPLQWSENIPAYDGREAFALTQLHKLPKIEHEIDIGSSVLVIFSASTYDARGSSQPKHVNKIVSVNAVAIILIAEPISMEIDEKDNSAPSTYASGDLGVESDHTLSSGDEQEKKKDDGAVMLL
ncbi:hypothetical protein BJ138DRAFT_1180981 [Hygrophoropsis aurantiaca]|uniref:Uncharacterized protein n=1 Tax=Hygrophoropsis aurantiaca TaxID=72124 RepID=A0ACB8A8H9_9AGAM|nr:hypothetical protein BJ138DRAFT_1180981 [Hygrophoropsis aurantiaca]